MPAPVDNFGFECGVKRSEIIHARTNDNVR